MGVGNTLLQDDGIGVHVTESLRTNNLTDPEAFDPGLEFIDGGTIGLSLLPEIEDAEAVIVVDASEIGDRPGALRIFRDREIDLQLSGRSPARRALVAIQPASTELGLEPTADVLAAIPGACAAIRDLARQWRTEASAHV